MMDRTELIVSIEEQIKALPILDAHTHLIDGKLGARGLHDVLLYHMAISELYAAGCPSGARLTQYPGVPSEDEVLNRLEEALPYLSYVRNTSISWGIRTILKDLYGWTETITADNYKRLDGIIRERADDRSWQREIIARANIKGFCTELARKENGEDADILQYALEWAFFTRTQWGEFDTALYEVERCWGRFPESPMPIGSGGRPKTEKVITTLSDVHEAVNWYVDHIPVDKVLSIATHISMDIDFRNVTDAEMKVALSNRDSARENERDIYASYVNEAFLTALEKYADTLLYQFSYGAEPLPFETSSRVSQKSIAQVAEMIGRHPKLRFQCFLSSRHANQPMCTIARELPNLSLIGYWWHNFFPGTIRQVMEERLDMLPTNKQAGFFSDAYCVEWAYGKAALVKHQMATVLADKVLSGQYSVDDAIDIAGEIFYQSPQTLNGMVAGR